MGLHTRTISFPSPKLLLSSTLSVVRRFLSHTRIVASLIPNFYYGTFLQHIPFPSLLVFILIFVLGNIGCKLICLYIVLHSDKIACLCYSMCSMQNTLAMVFLLFICFTLSHLVLFSIFLYLLTLMIIVISHTHSQSVNRCWEP